MDQDLPGKWRQYKSKSYLCNRHNRIQVKKYLKKSIMLTVLFHNKDINYEYMCIK